VASRQRTLQSHNQIIALWAFARAVYSGADVEPTRSAMNNVRCLTSRTVGAIGFLFTDNL
jgi:hypothetical protein